ncbi:MAG: hypothetical protein IPJ71_14355 [Bdellovibrionales bacterium]|nr:hypothetical protein [Bdellovibrionales bacterium]
MRRDTNHFPVALTHLDSIEFFQKCYWKNTVNYSDLFLNQGLSAAQIGEKLEIPKQTALNQPKREGIRLGTNKGRLVNPDNYCLSYAPYGFSKKDRRMVPNNAKLKICRLIV